MLFWTVKKQRYVGKMFVKSNIKLLKSLMSYGVNDMGCSLSYMHNLDINNK